MADSNLSPKDIGTEKLKIEKTPSPLIVERDLKEIARFSRKTPGEQVVRELAILSINSEGRDKIQKIIDNKQSDLSIEVLALKKEVQDIQKNIADREKYNYEQANANFEARYETDPPEKTGQWVLVKSKVGVPLNVRKTLTERKLPIDFKNNFNLKRGFIDIEEVYRDVDKGAQIVNTKPMFLSNVIEQQSRKAAIKTEFPFSQFNPKEIRIKNIYEENMLRLVRSLKDRKEHKLKSGAIKEYFEDDMNFYRLLLTTFGKSLLNYQGTHYPENQYYKIKLEIGHNKDKIAKITYYMKSRNDET